eukprot:COSAG06_NODE_32426_length_506_cov_1.009828_1_plen_28_part_01
MITLGVSYLLQGPESVLLKSKHASLPQF